MTDSQWWQPRFVVRVRLQAHFEYGDVQYLAAGVGDPGDGRGCPGESKWVIVRELSDEDDQPWDAEFDLFATMDLNAEASQAIFGDCNRLTVCVAALGVLECVRELDFCPLIRAACCH